MNLHSACFLQRDSGENLNIELVTTEGSEHSYGKLSPASSLQIFSPSSAAVISELEVSPSNRVSRADEKPIQPAAVEHVAITVEGNWMATVDRRKSDDDFGAEIHLKIWHWESSNWVLNTRIDRPHGSSNIISMSFSPLDDSQEGILLQTAGLDGQIRLWCRRRLARNEEGFDGELILRDRYGIFSQSRKRVLAGAV